MKALLRSIMPGVIFLAVSLAVMAVVFYFGPRWVFGHMFGPRDWIEDGWSQEQLRGKAAMYLQTPLPEDVQFLNARSDGGKDPTHWMVISSPRALDELVLSLEKVGFKDSSFSVSRPPREFSKGVRAAVDFGSFNDARSLVKSARPESFSDGVWVLIDRRRQAILICRYSS